MNKKRILISLSTIGAVAAIALAATGAFFSDTETSTGNVLAAGAIDLGVDNESFLNGVLNPGTTWSLTYDLDDGSGPAGGNYLFYDFHDLKPGDYGEDTISLHVRDNPSWICADTTLTSDDDVDCTEPELDEETAAGCNDPDVDAWDGELASEVNVMWWADDGDNVLEVGETVLNQGPFGAAPQDMPVTVTLADSGGNIWDGSGPVVSVVDNVDVIHYVAKAWCFGTLTPAPLPVGDYPNGPSDETNDAAVGLTSEDGGFTCSGAEVISNASQTDAMTLEVSFRAVQSRNNDGFLCNPPVATPTPTPTPSPSPTLSPSPE